jgi:cyanophycin synthetase
MQFRKLLALRGPNIWANHPVLEGWLDLVELKLSTAEGIPGFVERLLAWMPSLVPPSSAQQERDGFFERLGRETWHGHVLERLALELQRLAGTPVAFSRTSKTHKEGVYKVVVQYENEAVGRAALDAALRLCIAAVRDTPFNLDGEVEALRAIARRETPGLTTAALIKAARARRLPVRRLTADGLLSLGYGHHQRRLQFTQTDCTSAAAESLVRDRCLALTLLRQVGLPVPEDETACNPEEAWAAAESIGLPVTLRPCLGAGRRRDRRDLRTREQVADAYRRLASADGRVSVEEQIAGLCWRLLVVGEQLISAVLLDSTDGNGLVRGADVTASVDPDVARQAVDAARVLGLDVAGVDVVASDLRRPLGVSKGAIVGVHPRPSLVPHLRPGGDRRNVADAILSRLYPEGQNGRIPVVCVTGTNGKTTTTRLTAHLFAQVHKTVGMCCSEGVYVGSRLLKSGDCSGPKSAKEILYHPQVQAAVLEMARGGILREGLGFDRCDVAVVTNVAKGDHLGLNDVFTTEELARVKRTGVEVVLPEGAAVLNANDPLTAAMAEHSRGGVVFFARDPHHPVVVRHRAAGKRAAFVRNNHIILAEGDREMPLVDLAHVPLTHGGLIGFNVENALASAAAAWTVGVPFEKIREGLKTFDSVLDQLPGRFNLLEVNGATIILDYAHNISALESFLEVLPQFPHKRRSVVYAVPGDRSDDVIIRQAELLGGAYDRVILYEDTELRGRPDGSIFALMRQGLSKAGRVRDILDIRGNMKAIETALSLVRPGELLVIQPEFPDVVAEYFSRPPVEVAHEVPFDQALARTPALAVEVR